MNSFVSILASYPLLSLSCSHTAATSIDTLGLTVTASSTVLKADNQMLSVITKKWKQTQVARQKHQVEIREPGIIHNGSDNIWTETSQNIIWITNNAKNHTAKKYKTWIFKVTHLFILYMNLFVF